LVRRVRFSRDRRVRRNLIWTTAKSVAKQLQHEQMRQRQDARKADRLRREQEAEARRLAAEKAEGEERERASARDWWEEISRPQWEELLAAIAEYAIKRTAAKAEPRSEQTEAQYAYGVAIYAGGKLYGIARPHPASLYRLKSNVLIFVRSTHEAERILAAGNVAADRVVNFGFPDHEQLQLC
jgi:hypothetical protein